MTFTEILTKLREVLSAIVLVCLIVLVPVLCVGSGVLGYVSLTKALEPLTEVHHDVRLLHANAVHYSHHWDAIRRDQREILERLKAIEAEQKRGRTGGGRTGGGL